jgi:hypothetical protein
MGYKNRYKNMDKSNLTFLNADGSANHASILAQIQKDLDAELAKIPFSEKAKRDAVFAIAEDKIKRENRRYDLENFFGRTSSILTTTQTGLSTLGIKPPPVDKSAPIGGGDNYIPPKDEGSNMILIIGGVVVALGIIGFVVYKMKK